MAGKAITDSSDMPTRSAERILNAAEMLFAERGYAGASMRDIARAADAPVSLITHHFSTKEELFRHVIDRRIHEQVDATLADIAKARESAPDGVIALETLIRCYIEPMIIRSMQGEAGWKNYAKLMGLAMFSRQYDDFLKPMINVYDRLQQEFTQEIRRIFPDADEHRLHLAIFFLHATILNVLNESGMLDRQSGGICQSADLPAILDEMVPFFAAAFQQRLKSV